MEGLHRLRRYWDYKFLWQRLNSLTIEFYFASFKFGHIELCAIFPAEWKKDCVAKELRCKGIASLPQTPYIFAT